MSGLEHSLQMGRIALGQRQLFGKRSERDSPGNHAFFSGHLEQPIKPSGNGVGEGEVVDRGERDGMSRGNVGANYGTDGDAGIARFRGSENRKQSELFALGQPAPRDGDGREYGKASF